MLIIYVRALLISFVIGMVAGFVNRAIGKAAGPRTFAIVSTGSTLVTLVSMYFCANIYAAVPADPGRISAQIVASLGFLGTGMLLYDEKAKHRVRGLSSAASLWVTAIIGMMIGADLIAAGIAAFIFVSVVHIGINRYIEWEEAHRDRDRIVDKKPEK